MKSNRCLVSISTCSHVARALTMIGTFLEHNANCDVLLVIPDLTDARARSIAWPLAGRLKVAGVDALAGPAVARMHGYFNAFELCCALKSFALEHALHALGYETALLLDPDIVCYGAFDAAWEALERKSLCLTPHCSSPMPDDGCSPDDRELTYSGFINGGFWALRRGAGARACLDWMKEKVVHFGFFLPRLGLYADQIWMSSLPWLFPAETEILRHPGYNAAYWNLHERDLRVDAGGYACNGEPLVFFHFSGFDPARPEQLTRFSARPYGALNRVSIPALLREYADRLASAGRSMPAIAPDRPCTSAPVSTRLRQYRKTHGSAARLQIASEDLLAMRLKDWYRALMGRPQA